MAPEILDTSRTSPTDETVDWWAVGIIAFEFITGNLPFNAKTKEEVFSNIRSMKIWWPEKLPDGTERIPFLLKDFIIKLLNPDFKTWLGAKGANDVKSHSYFDNINWR